MSPTEADLRAALSDGEGEGRGVDADGIIAYGREIRTRRRVRILSTAAAVLVVAGGATGVSALVAHDSGPSGTAGADQAAGNVPAGLHRGAAGLGAKAPSGTAVPAAGGDNMGNMSAPAGSIAPDQRSAPMTAPGPGCPATSGHLPAAGGRTPGRYSSSGPMFAQPVSSFRVCVYSLSALTTPSRARTVEVVGAYAQTLAASIEGAATKPNSVPCPLIRSSGQYTLVMTPITPSGTALPTVTAVITIPACNTMVTNGTSVRYDWRMPPDLARLLAIPVVGGGVDMPIDPRPPVSAPVPVPMSGHVSASPIHR